MAAIAHTVSKIAYGTYAPGAVDKFPGLPVTYVAYDVGQVGGSNGYKFTNDGRTFLHFKNTNASVRVITFISRRANTDGFIQNVVVDIPATTGDIMIGPFPKGRFDDSAGQVTFWSDDDENLTFRAFSLSEQGL